MCSLRQHTILFTIVCIELTNVLQRNSMLESTIQSLQDELSAVHQEMHRMTGLIQDIKLIGQKGQFDVWC